MRKEIENLFREYEEAFDALDIKRSAQFFADTFISAGPKGTIAVNKTGFLKQAEKASDFYKSAGQTSAKIISKKYTPFSDRYTMVTVHWGATFKKLGNKPVEFDVSYLVQHTGNQPEIILFISHQDEEEAMKKLVLI